MTDSTVLDLPEGLPSIEEQKDALRHAVIDTEHRYRVIFVGNFFQGPTGIVASIHRALENLGHTVFKLDTKRHPHVLDRSSGAKGGYGPIWFRPESIERIIDSFQPDMIVLCAGGIVLDPEGSVYLRERDVVSVGLTLSDPDVQDSVIEHVGNFDLHTTNAQLSFDRYLDEGHTNTFLFPFGIDRTYILRDVPKDPSLQADAIAIGHAQGRPDRHAVMVPLAERVHVRAYGSGWPLPGSEPVSGDRLLQAAKGGSIHVNFPATRAGFTNVKCGVFETIGAGAVLATTHFDEMARLFEYGEEIIAYADADDLADTVSDLVSDPVRLETMRRRGFRRLIADHLYEQRWNLFFQEARDLLCGSDGPWDDENRARISAALARHRDRPRNIIISGYYGARNRGDDILLDALRTRITQEVPDANVIAAAVNPRAVEQQQGVQAFLRADPFESDNYASSATSVILGPGGLWHDYTIQKANGVAGIVTGATLSPSHLAQLPLMVRAYGGTFHAHGLGVGPLSDVAAKASVRLTGLLAESVTVRDEESRQLLLDCCENWPAQPVVSPDVAYTLPLADVGNAPTHTLPSAEYIAVNVRPFQENAASVDAIRDVVLRYARENGLAVLGVPMQPVDTEALLKWTEHAEGIEFSVLPQDAPYGVFLRSLRDARAIVSMRLHTNLFAHRLGKAPVGIAYDPKLTGHFAQLGRGKFALPMPVDRDLLRERLCEADASGNLDEQARSRISALERTANATLNSLCTMLREAPRQLPNASSMVQAPPKDQSSTDRGPLGWPPEQNVNLRGAVAVGGSLEDSDRVVEISRRSLRAGSQFQLVARAPLKGDFASWSLDVPVPRGEGGVRLEILLVQKYKEKPRLAGRMAYDILLDGTALFREDVTAWSERTSIWIGKRTTDASVKLEIRLMALRNTENWGWGRATATLVEGIRALPWAPTQDLVWGSSSPGAVSLSPPRSTANNSGTSQTSAGPADPLPAPRPLQRIRPWWLI